MAPYEATYGRKCRSPLHWEIDDQWTPKEKRKSPSIPKVDLVQEAMEKGGKLNPRYIGPYKILQRIGKLAYRLKLPAQYAGMHDVFHVSRLKKYQPDPEHIITRDAPPLMEIYLTPRNQSESLTSIRQLRSREIPMVKVVWQNHNRDEDATWEMEEDMRNQYPELF
ncbi:hypothetical protein DH2020_043496 [Rehmannia glutinosa]|uniref:Tf2-1-like SH3-like domain-containing protein n=1 Tax=Rehmannia glutinosa TaxID=99300 RepID=A0ABR0UJG6_REHGL